MDDKIYHNITINYNSTKLVSDDRNTSLAETNVEVMDPLITTTKDYDICISKFRLDTLTIPLVIPELKQPQLQVDNKIELDYWVKLIAAKKAGEVTEERAYKTYAIKYLYIVPKNFDMSNDLNNPRTAYKSYKPVKRKVMVTEKDAEGNDIQVEKAFLDNLDPFCYIYEPQEFVDSMNNAIAEAYRAYNKEGEAPKFAFFYLDNGKLTFYQDATTSEKLIFSPNLYRFFGVGFNTRRVPSENGFMIANDRATRTPCFEDEEADNSIGDYGEPSEKGQWNIARNHFPVTQIWNACKALLICSYSLPVKGEFIPISDEDGMLIHENSKTCKRNYEEFHGSDQNSGNLGDVGLLTPTYKVLESFYPVSAEGGDIRSGIIFSNDAMDVSTKLELIGDFTQLKKFDIAIRWIDIYNNIHNLELMEGSSCDIRIAFVKKSVKQDIIYEGFREVVKRLGGQPDPYPPPMTKARIVRTNTTIELPKADKYGFTKV